jgi:hypothetical protein
MNTIYNYQFDLDNKFGAYFTEEFAYELYNHTQKQLALYSRPQYDNGAIVGLIISVLLWCAMFKGYAWFETRSLQKKIDELEDQITDTENENAELVLENMELDKDIIRLNRDLTESADKIKALHLELNELYTRYSGCRQSAEKFLASFPHLDTQG